MDAANYEIALLVALSSMIYVFLKAFQQLNVFHNKVALVPMLSVMMAYAEWLTLFTGLGAMLSTGWNHYIVLSYGAGGAVGCIAAMYLHKFVRRIE